MINFRLIRHLWIFLAVAEEEHFGRAAKRLSMTQPPVTEAIQALEQALQVRLFDRSRRGASLTPAGNAILPALRKFADQLERLEMTVREAAHGQTSILTIGAITTAMSDPLPQLLAKLRKDFPSLTISVREIDSVEAIPALENGDLDLAFARLSGDLGPGIETVSLKQDRLAVALPDTHPLASSSRIRLASLAGEAFVMFKRSVSPVYFDNITAACLDAGFSPRIPHEVRTVASQVAFVGCGQGIALVPSALRKTVPSNVVIRPLKESIKIVTTAMAWSTRRHNQMVDAVVAALRSEQK